MKIGFVADVHLGNHIRFGGEVKSSINRRAQLVADTLRRAGERADQLGCSTIYLLGDLFDTHHPIPQLIDLAQRSMVGPEWVLLVGNHDQKSPAPRDHAMAAMSRMVAAEPSLSVPPGTDTVFLAIPFGPGSSTEWIRKQVDVVLKEKFRIDVLLIHAGVADDSTPPWLREADDAITVADLHAVMAKAGARRAFAGNWHSAQRWKLEDPPAAIYQVGTLCPTGFDNPGLNGYGLLVMLDTETMEVDAEEIPGPRFVKVSSDDELRAVMAEFGNFPQREQYSLFVEYQASVDVIDPVAARLGALEAEGLLAGWEILPDRSRSEKTAREAAQAASGQQTTEAALVAYVEAMELPADVDRGRVLELSRGFLAGR